MTLLDAVTDYIEKELSGFDQDNLLINFYPDDPDNIVSVIDLGGLPPSKYAITRDKKIELKYRTKSYQEGIKLGNQLYDLFHAHENYHVGDFFITTSYANTDVDYLYQDSKGRREFSLELVFQYQYK